MKLRVRILNLDAGGKTIAIINKKDAHELGVAPLDRIVLAKDKKKLTAIVNMTDKFVHMGEILVYNEIRELMNLKQGDILSAKPREELESKQHIKKKLDGYELNYKEILSIVKDVLARDLNDLEQASLITALQIHGLTQRENLYFAKAIIDMSEKIKFPGIVVDKHSVGGVPGDKTTLLLVPIIASAGLKIPKTSSRAITDPAGTADRMEVLAPVELDIKKIKKVIRKTNGCMVWGGSLNLAPADDLFIQIERPLALDPLLIPSVLSKKKVVGSKSVVIDIPCGSEAKFRTKKEAERITRNFEIIGKKLGMRVKCIITDAKQPVGYAIGPALESREALQAIMNPKIAAKDLVEKVIKLSGAIFKMVNKGNEKTAMKILFSGKAEKKLRDIIKAQGGNPKIKPEDIKFKFSAVIKAKKSGMVFSINNKTLIYIAKLAGAPKDKLAGILLNKKIGDSVERREVLYTIYAEKMDKLNHAVKFAKNNGYTIIVKQENNTD